MYIFSQPKTQRILSSTESSQFQGESLTTFFTFHAVWRKVALHFPPAVDKMLISPAARRCRNSLIWKCLASVSGCKD